MNFYDYFLHYLEMPDFIFFFIISFMTVIFIHVLLLTHALNTKKVSKTAGKQPSRYTQYQFLREQYYELVFSATSTLLFTGIYFMMDYQWIKLPENLITFWNKYSDFLLLLLLVLSIVLINLMDRIIIPLKRLDIERIGALRMAGMIYMLVIFAYIKFIYQDDNYDTIIFYFITMLIGRYVYMDASFKSFSDSFHELLTVTPILLLVLISTALLALYGFSSDYLIKSNGVVTNLFLAHCFMIVDVFIINTFEHFSHFAKNICQKH